MQHRGRGTLITLEGGEGSGKSTQARTLARLLKSEGYRVVLTCEPADTELGRFLLSMLRKEGSLTAEAELYLFEAARAQHVNGLIRPALESGEIVLCDRYTDSTIAYQGYGRGLDVGHIREANRIATQGLSPDLTVLLDLPPEMGLDRKRGDTPKDSIGSESLEFHRRVREGFLATAGEEPERIVVLDTTQPAEQASEVIWERVQAFLRREETVPKT